MKPNTRLLFLVLIVAALLFGACRPKAEKEVTFFPGYGYRGANGWNIHLRGWVHKPRSHASAFISELAKIKGICGDVGMKNFAARTGDFDADDKSFEVVTVKFDSDPEDKSYTLDKSGPDGIVQIDVVINDERAKQMLEKQGSSNRWLTYRTTSKEYTGSGRIRLIESEPDGVSLISDIDDTIKVTEVPAGHDAMFKNAFCREYQPLPEMAARYQALGDIPVHYVSGGPEQLFGPVHDFFMGGPGGFPEGTFHLRVFPKNLLLKEARENLSHLGESTLGDTFNHKMKEITELMTRFPDRKFILVGDSGEVDPEVYSRIRSERPAQVKEIWIRDVINDNETNPYRLEGMQIIKVPLPVCAENKHFENLSERINKAFPKQIYKRNTAAPCSNDVKKT